VGDALVGTELSDAAGLAEDTVALSEVPPVQPASRTAPASAVDRINFFTIPPIDVRDA